jgi:hypothetical protein
MQWIFSGVDFVFPGIIPGKTKSVSGEHRRIVLQKVTEAAGSLPG